MRIRANTATVPGDRVFLITTDRTGKREKDRMELDPETMEPLEDESVPRPHPRRELNNGFYPQGKLRG